MCQWRKLPTRPGRDATTRWLRFAGTILCCVWLSGCVPEQRDVELSLIIVDELADSADSLLREVILLLPDGPESEEVARRVLVQAEYEGWQTIGGQGSAYSIAQRHPDNERLAAEVRARSGIGVMLSASKTFSTQTRSNSGIFTAIFGPDCQVTRTDRHVEVVAKVHARSIGRALLNEAVRYARSRGYDSSGMTAHFASPVIWQVVCPTKKVQASRGTVARASGHALIETRMSGSEFMAEEPIKVAWEIPRKLPAHIVFLLCCTACAAGLFYLWYRSSRSSPRPKRPPKVRVGISANPGGVGREGGAPKAETGSTNVACRRGRNVFVPSQYAGQMVKCACGNVVVVPVRPG